MKIEQKLSSGLIVRKDLKDCVRFVFFETNAPGWEYATYGGSAFIVNYKGKIYALTCNHVFGDFDSSKLALTNKRFGDMVAGYDAIFRPKDPILEAVDTDILDLAVIRFTEDCQSQFFGDDPYIIDDETICTSEKNEKILIEGSLKDLSAIDDKTIKAQFCSLEIIDDGYHEHDATLRSAYGQFLSNIEFSSVTGISGSPVFNLTKGKLCGMAVRGGLNEKKFCNVFYIDIEDIKQVLQAIHEDRPNTSYKKIRPKKIP